jgi:hypothetical protein
MYKKDINFDSQKRIVSLSEFHCRLRHVYGVMRCLCETAYGMARPPGSYMSVEVCRVHWGISPRLARGLDAG